MTDSYDSFKKQIHLLTGVDLDSYKENQMKRRLDMRMMALRQFFSLEMMLLLTTLEILALLSRSVQSLRAQML